MRYSSNRNLAREARNLSQVRAALRTTALRLAPVVQAATAESKHGGWYTGRPTPSGGTKASVHVESGHRANDGRPAVRIVLGGAVVPQNWRQDRSFILRAVAESGGAR